MSTIEIEIPAQYIYILYVQKNAWHPPVVKYHVLRRRHGMHALVPCSQTPYLRVTFG